MEGPLRLRFGDLWARTVGAGAEAAWRALDAGYGSPGRHYHGWRHVADLLAGHDAVRERPDFIGLDHDAIDLAIVFHDAVYEIGRGDDEARSADLLAACAGPAADTDRLRAAQAMIHATATHESDPDPATCLMIDLDLAVLGAAPPGLCRLRCRDPAGIRGDPRGRLADRSRRSARPLPRPAAALPDRPLS